MRSHCRDPRGLSCGFDNWTSPGGGSFLVEGEHDFATSLGHQVTEMAEERSTYNNRQRTEGTTMRVITESARGITIHWPKACPRVYEQQSHLTYDRRLSSD